MSPPSPLTRRPQATAFSIEDLLDRVRRGEVRTPEFQRSFQWKAKDIRDLLDSLYRGYPIGTLLFWKREGPADLLHFGPVKIDAPQTAQALWAVDGQQRITALTGVLLHPPMEDAHDDFAFYFDLETEEFVRRSKREALPAHWLPMSVVLDSEQLLDWLSHYPDRKEKPHHTRTAMKLGKTLREYQVPAYIVEADEPKTLRIIFERLNSAGRPLKRADVFNALHGASEKHPSNLEALGESLKDMGFGTIEAQWLLKAVLSVRGLDITRDFKQQIKEEENLTEALLQTERALRAVIVFIKKDVGIPHIELLPYKLPLVLLARFFHLHPEPSARSRELLARWIWRGAVTGRHRGESIPQVRHTLQAIGADEERSVQQLLSQLNVFPFDETAETRNDYNFRTAWTKLEVNALLALHPRDLRTGHPLDAPTLLEHHGASALPQIFTGLSGARLHKVLTHGIANRLFHPPMKERTPLALLSATPPPEASVLESHAIPPEAPAFLHPKNANPLAVLIYRQQLLSKHIPLFLQARMRWDESDHGSIQSMIVSDEED